MDLFKQYYVQNLLYKLRNSGQSYLMDYLKWCIFESNEPYTPQSKEMMRDLYVSSAKSQKELMEKFTWYLLVTPE